MMQALKSVLLVSLQWSISVLHSVTERQQESMTASAADLCGLAHGPQHHSPSALSIAHGTPLLWVLLHTRDAHQRPLPNRAAESACTLLPAL